MFFREDMEITSSSLVLPVVFGKFDKEIAELVIYLTKFEIKS